MTPVQRDSAYSIQLDGMVKATAEKENLRHLALMAREAMSRRDAELSMPADEAQMWIWSDLHFRRGEDPQTREAPVRDRPHDELDPPRPLAGDRGAKRHGDVRRGPRRPARHLRSVEVALRFAEDVIREASATLLRLGAARLGLSGASRPVMSPRQALRRNSLVKMDCCAPVRSMARGPSRRRCWMRR